MPMPRFSMNPAIVESSDVFEQFDLGLAQFEEGRAHLLVGHFLDRVTFQAQYVLPVGNRFIEALHCNAKMLNVRYFHNK